MGGRILFRRLTLSAANYPPFVHLKTMPSEDGGINNPAATFSALTLHSSNDKTGNIAVSTTSRHTCPPTCPLSGKGGCYAEAGFYTRIHWDAVSAGRRGLPFASFLSAVARIPNGRRFRHNVAGDLWHVNGRICGQMLRSLANAAQHLTAWTYTHHLPSAPNLAAIRSAIRRGFVVNISTESRFQAAKLAKRGLPVVCVVPKDAPPHFTYKGVRFRQCPATFDDSPTKCANCGGGTPLCAIKDRSFVVTFPAHGMRAVVASAVCG